MNGKTTGLGATSREAPLPRATPCLFPEPRAFEPLKSSYARQADGDSPSPGGAGRGEGEMTAPASARVPSVQSVPSMGFSFQGKFSPFAYFAYFAVKNAFFSFPFSPLTILSSRLISTFNFHLSPFVL